MQSDDLLKRFIAGAEIVQRAKKRRIAQAFTVNEIGPVIEAFDAAEALLAHFIAKDYLNADSDTDDAGTDSGDLDNLGGLGRGSTGQAPMRTP